MKFIYLQQTLGYTFSCNKILKQALTHRSISKNHNERLEFLGDSILNFVLSNFLYSYFPHINEGDMSRMRATLVCRDTLSNIAREFRLEEYLFFSSNETKHNVFLKQRIMANTIEAIIGAIFLDSDINNVEKIILKWYAIKLQKIKPGDHQKDPKTRLQEYLQEKHLPLPLYKTIKIKGEPHNPEFIVHCFLNKSNKPTVGSGPDRRKAEQEAARQALLELGILN